MKLVREHINEKFTEDDSDPIKDMGIGIGDVVQLSDKFPKLNHNPHYIELCNLIEKGVFIGVKIHNKIIFNIYKHLSDLIVPFFQNSSLYDVKDHYKGEADYIKKINEPFIINHHYTVGRYDINYSNTWNLTSKQISLAKKLYKGKQNEEYPFFISKKGYQIVFIISKSGKFITLVFERTCPEKLKKYFTKSPVGDYYLGKWISSNEAVLLVKKFVKIIK